MNTEYKIIIFTYNFIPVDWSNLYRFFRVHAIVVYPNLPAEKQTKWKIGACYGNLSKIYVFVDYSPAKWTEKWLKIIIISRIRVKKQIHNLSVLEKR